jgi:hypothetical protein
MIRYTVENLSDDLTKGDPWKIQLFNFVDGFRTEKENKEALISMRPSNLLPAQMQSLIASTVASLAEEAGIEYPLWCLDRSYFLKDPWFVSGVKSLYATALTESPLHYRRNNIFVLDNFLSRC